MTSAPLLPGAALALTQASAPIHRSSSQMIAASITAADMTMASSMRASSLRQKNLSLKRCAND
jgi:hypothetical protein